MEYTSPDEWINSPEWLDDYQITMDEEYRNAYDFFDSIDCKVEFENMHGPGSPVFPVVRLTDFEYQYSNGYDMSGYDIPEGRSNGYYMCEVLIEEWHRHLPELQAQQRIIDSFDDYDDYYYDACDRMCEIFHKAVEQVAEIAAQDINAMDEYFYSDEAYQDYYVERHYYEGAKRKSAGSYWLNDSWWDRQPDNVGETSYYFQPLNTFVDASAQVNVLEIDGSGRGRAEVHVDVVAMDPDGSYELAYEDCGTETIDFANIDELEDRIYDMYDRTDTYHVEQVAEEVNMEYWDNVYAKRSSRRKHAGITVRDFIKQNIDIDVVDDYCEDLYIAFCGPLELTAEGEKEWADVLDLTVEIMRDIAVVNVNDNEHTCHRAAEFFNSVAGYCTASDWDRWFIL